MSAATEAHQVRQREVDTVLAENRRTVEDVDRHSNERRAAYGRARLYLTQLRRSLRRRNS